MENNDSFLGGSAPRIIASVYGILVGLAGIEHGILEVLQGNVAIEGTEIDAIGPAQRVWEHASETALTIVPNFLATGILAIIVGILVTVWSARYIGRKHGALIFLGLGIVLFLVGGGFAPIILTLLAAATAARIGKRPRFWAAVLPRRIRVLLARLWPEVLIILVVAFVVGVETAIFGYPLLWIFDADTTYAIQWGLAYVMVAAMFLTIPAGFAHEIQKQAL